MPGARRSPASRRTPTSTSWRRGSRHFAGDGARPKTVFIVHGDPDAADAFADRVRNDLGMEARRSEAPPDRGDAGRVERQERPPLISFLTDFGLDGAAATCRGVMLDICPTAASSTSRTPIPKYAIRDGAIILRVALPYLPVGVHVGVVDPGRRHRPAGRSASGRAAATC